MTNKKIDTDAILANTDLVELVSRYVELKPKGREYVGLCVNHADTDPSMRVVPDKGFVHCFPCGFHANAISFLMHMEQIEFIPACKRLTGEDKSLPDPKPVAKRILKKAPSRRTFAPPADTPAPDMELKGLGQPTHTWTYRTLTGDVMGYVARYAETDRKEIRCWSWGNRLDHEAAYWSCGHFSEPRPLYGLEKLANTEKQVLIVEGELTTDAATRLFPKHLVLSWPGGSESVKKADWTVLKGRKVVLIPDADDAGHKAMSQLSEILHKIGAKEIKRIKVKKTISGDDAPKGWDLADEPPETTPEMAMQWAISNIYTDNNTIDAQAAAKSSEIHLNGHDRDDDPPTPERSSQWQKTQPRPISQGIDLSAEVSITSKSLGVVSRRMSDVKIRAVNWLWAGKIPLGKVTGISGNPGLGKSQITASLAAIVSVGGKWPVTRDQAPLGSVLLLNAEDDADDTLGPRLLAAGADLSRIHIIDAIRTTDDRGDTVNRGLDLVRDLERVAVVVDEIGDVKLIIIDPVSAYMGGADSHKMADVVGIMARLKTLASRTHCAVIMVNHLNKSAGQDALLKTQGSIGFVSHARAVWGVCKDKDDPNKRYFVPLKNNLGPDSEAASLSYQIEEFHLTDSEPLITTSRIMWDAQAVTKSAQELMASAEPGEDTTTDCEDFLKDILQFGPVPVQEVELSARKAGHLHGTLRRAKARLKVESIKGMGINGKWQWKLPEPKNGKGSYQGRDNYPVEGSDRYQ